MIADIKIRGRIYNGIEINIGLFQSVSRYI